MEWNLSDKEGKKANPVFIKFFYFDTLTNTDICKKNRKNPDFFPGLFSKYCSVNTSKYDIIIYKNLHEHEHEQILDPSPVVQTGSRSTTVLALTLHIYAPPPGPAPPPTLHLSINSWFYPEFNVHWDLNRSGLNTIKK